MEKTFVSQSGREYIIQHINALDINVIIDAMSQETNRDSLLPYQFVGYVHGAFDTLPDSDINHYVQKYEIEEGLSDIKSQFVKAINRYNDAHSKLAWLMEDNPEIADITNGDSSDHYPFDMCFVDLSYEVDRWANAMILFTQGKTAEEVAEQVGEPPSKPEVKNTRYYVSVKTGTDFEKGWIFTSDIEPKNGVLHLSNDMSNHPDIPYLASTDMVQEIEEHEYHAIFTMSNFGLDTTDLVEEIVNHHNELKKS